MTGLIPVTGFATRMALRWRQALLVVLLALLHVVVSLGPADPLARTLFVVDLGLFLLWQPFVRTDRRIAMPSLLIMLALVATISLNLNGWILVVWIALLAGVVGGKVFLFEARWTKYFYLLALSWLVAALLLLVLPATVPDMIHADATVDFIGRVVSPVVFAVMLLLPRNEEAAGQPEVVDFVYSVIVVLLLAVLALGSLAIMLLAGHRYIEALLESLLGIGLMLLILGWVWNPHLGMAGVGTVFSRYLMSIGMPVEQWLHALADLAQRVDDPDDFVAGAARDMVQRLPWVIGVAWSADGAQGSCGVLSGKCSEFAFDELTVRIHTRYPLSPSLTWHFNLLAQLMAEFRADKQRARRLKRLSYVEAIHETGARLTHDVKNLLQSLRTLCSAAQAEDKGDAVSPEFTALLRRQLPAITERLGQTLEKLQVPRLDANEQLPAMHWWRELEERYAFSGIGFLLEGDGADSTTIPAALFNLAAENMIANALGKRAAAPELKIRTTLAVQDGEVTLEVCDDGQEIAPALAADLFLGPVPSETGMGIGLYQASRLLEQGGYRLQLAANQPGRVCFRLAPL